MAVRHKQIGTDKETGTGPATAVRRLRYIKPTDFGAKLVVLTIFGEVPHLFKVWSAEDKIRDFLEFWGPFDNLIRETVYETHRKSEQ